VGELQLWNLGKQTSKLEDLYKRWLLNLHWVVICGQVLTSRSKVWGWIMKAQKIMIQKLAFEELTLINFTNK
jgi:hypothetical protein